MCYKEAHFSNDFLHFVRANVFLRPLFCASFCEKKAVPKTWASFVAMDLLWRQCFLILRLRKSQPFGPLFVVISQKRVLPKNWAPCMKRSERELTSLPFLNLIGCLLLPRWAYFQKIISFSKKWSNFWTFRNNYEKSSLSRITCKWSLLSVTMSSL